MGKIKVKKKEGKKQITIAKNIFKNEDTAAHLLHISKQLLYKNHKDDKYDRNIEDFINRLLDDPFFPKFELKPYRKALCLLVDYEDTIINLFKGINYPKYKNKEKLFVDTLYNCPIWKLDAYFPDEKAKEGKIIELKDQYEQERDQSVRRWVKIITFYLLITKKDLEKTYNKIYDILYTEKILDKKEKKIKNKIKKYGNIYNPIFIHSFCDFYIGITNGSIRLPTLFKNETEFDYVLKTNTNDSLNNETIGILKNRFWGVKNGIYIFGDILFIQRINDTDIFLKKAFYIANNYTLIIIDLNHLYITIYHLEEENYYIYIDSVSWAENKYTDNKDNTFNSFFIIDRDNCKISPEIEEITKNIRNMHKTELEKVEEDLTARVSTDISPERREFLASEGFNLNYTFQISLGKLGVIIVDNKEFRYYDPEDYFFNI